MRSQKHPGTVYIDCRDGMMIFGGCLFKYGKLAEAALGLSLPDSLLSKSLPEKAADTTCEAVLRTIKPAMLFNFSDKNMSERKSDFCRHVYADLALFHSSVREMCYRLGDADRLDQPTARICEQVLLEFKRRGEFERHVDGQCESSEIVGLKSGRKRNDESANGSERTDGHNSEWSVGSERVTDASIYHTGIFVRANRRYFDRLYDLLAFDLLNAVGSGCMPACCEKCGRFIFLKKGGIAHRCGSNVVPNYRRVRRRNLIFRLTATVCAATLVLSGTMLALKQYQRWRASAAYGEIAKSVKTAGAAVTDGAQSEYDKNGVLMQYSALHGQNGDMVGWIRLDGTVINYPVMQSKQENYYLKHDFYKNRSGSGAIYIPNQCSVTQPSDNIVMYGHNMRDGSMFAALCKYRSKSFFEEHPTIGFDTLYERAEYEVVRVMSPTAYGDDIFPYYKYTVFDSEESFNEFFDRVGEYSLYDTNKSVAYGDRFITLSTCEYSKKDGRMVIIARRLD